MVRPMDAAALDFAVAAWREEGTWRAEALPARDGTTIDGLTRSLQALPAESGAIALVSVADDFFLILRVDGTGSRLLLSDAATAHDWPLAAEALDELGLELPDDEDVEPHVVAHGGECFGAGLSSDRVRHSSSCAWV